MEEIYIKLSDEKLVELISAGDVRAQDFLLNKYKNMVRSFVRIYIFHGGAGEDIIQEGMIGLFKAIRDFDAKKNVAFKSFALLCIKRQIISAVKSSNCQKHRPLNNYVSLDKGVSYGNGNYMEKLFVSENNDPQKIVELKDEVRSMYEKIEDKLSDFERKVLYLYLNGQSYGEMSIMLGKTNKSVDNALQRVKKKLM